MTSTWEDLVTVALLGTDRRPLPDDLPPAWAGNHPSADPTAAVLAYAARHRAAVRAGSSLPTAAPPADGPPAAEHDREPGPPEVQQELADALDRGTAGPVNDALAVLADVDGTITPDLWTATAALAARNPRVDRAVLARALGARGVWFVGRNPQWARLAAALQHRRSGAAG